MNNQISCKHYEIVSGVYEPYIYLNFTFKFHIKFRKKSKVMGFNRGSSIIPEQCHFFRRNAVTCSVA